MDYCYILGIQLRRLQSLDTCCSWKCTQWISLPNLPQWPHLCWLFWCECKDNWCNLRQNHWISTIVICHYFIHHHSLIQWTSFYIFLPPGRDLLRKRPQSLAIDLIYLGPPTIATNGERKPPNEALPSLLLILSKLICHETWLVGCECKDNACNLRQKVGSFFDMNMNFQNITNRQSS